MSQKLEKKTLKGLSPSSGVGLKSQATIRKFALGAIAFFTAM
jgi:hypothetical protein